MSRFMAYVHTSVNTISKAYLANERRYNYTTPKSYLEQISLYAKLVYNKTDELRAKITRCGTLITRNNKEFDYILLYFLFRHF